MYKYLRLTYQFMEVRFEFRKSRLAVSGPATTPAKTKPFNGTIQVVLTIARQSYGPFTTDIRTSREVWDGRKSVRVGSASKALIAQLSEYQNLLETAYQRLKEKGGILDGPAVMNAVRYIQTAETSDQVESLFEVVTLQRVYDEFLAYKASRIEADRRKRKDDQISKATYETYPRRWVLLLGYLTSMKRAKLAVLAVNAPFAQNLKEWLIGQKQTSGLPYEPASINKVISFLKSLLTYAVSKGYIPANPVRDFSCRGGSPANPKPLTLSQIETLEACPLTPFLRHVCDSWLVASELCLHYSDYMELKTASIQTRPNGKGQIQLERSKQAGTSLKQTVNVTERAERLIAKWGGLKNLHYKGSSNFSKNLKLIAQQADLRDEQGEVIRLEFGQGRDTGLTHRAIQGATTTQLQHMGGWSKAAYANRYIGLPREIIDGFVDGLDKEEMINSSKRSE